MSKIALFVFFLFMFYSCIQVKKQAQVNLYFDFKAFFENNFFENCSGEIMKKVEVDTQLDQEIISMEDALEELKFIKEYDLNKPSLLGKYKVDTVIQNQDMIVRYSSMSEKNNIKTMSIHFRENEFKKVLIERYQKSFLNTLEEKINISSCELILERKSKTVFSKPVWYKIHYFVK